MKSLVFWGRGRVEAARRRGKEGAEFVLWRPAGEASLRAAAVPFETASSRFGKEQEDWISSAVEAWIQAWPHLPLVDGRSFAEEVAWKGESLAWCAEAFLRRSGASPRCVRLLETFRLLLEGGGPDEVEAMGMEGDEAVLLGRVCIARKILFHGPALAPRRPPAGTGPVLRGVWNTFTSFGRALLLRDKQAGGTGDKAPVLWLLDEDPVSLPAEARADGTPVPLRVDARRYSRLAVEREVRGARAVFARQWRRLRRSPGLQEGFRHRGVGFADLAARDLDELMLLELPRAARRFEEVAATLRALRPRLAFVGHEDRAAQAACRAAETPFAFWRGFKGGSPPPDRDRRPGVIGC